MGSNKIVLDMETHPSFAEASEDCSKLLNNRNKDGKGCLC